MLNQSMNHLLWWMLLFCGLSVSLTCSYIVPKWQKITINFLLHTTVPCLFQIMLIFGIHRPDDLSDGDIRWQIAAEWLEIAQWSQWSACRKLTLLFRMVPLLILCDLPFSQNGGLMHLPGPTLQCVLPPGEYVRRSMSPVAKYLWTLWYQLTLESG